MGQLISGPVTFKDTKMWENSQLLVAASSMQGWRLKMEDAYVCFLNLPSSAETSYSASTSSSCNSTSYFAVFDGHGGTKISEYAATNLHTKIMAQPAYAKGDLVEAMRSGVLKLDVEMQASFTGHSSQPTSKRSSTNPSEFPNPSDFDGAKLLSSMDVGGSACIALLLRENWVYCANCGDSRAVLSRQGLAEALSVDHKPSMVSEWNRIVAAGGWVAANRVNGNLALSRALGDFVYKRNSVLAAEEQIVSAEPDITQCELRPAETDEFIVIACDGIWDVMTNQEVISYVRCRLASGYSPDLICEELMVHCMAPTCNPNGLGCDNMTVVIICFLNGGTLDDLKQRCSRTCPAGVAVDVMLP